MPFSLKNNSTLPKLIIHYLGKEVQNKPTGDEDVDIVDNDATSYLIDGGVQLNKNRKYYHFHFLSLKWSIN